MSGSTWTDDEVNRFWHSAAVTFTSRCGNVNRWILTRKKIRVLIMLIQLSSTKRKRWIWLLLSDSVESRFSCAVTSLRATGRRHEAKLFAIFFLMWLQRLLFAQIFDQREEKASHDAFDVGKRHHEWNRSERKKKKKDFSSIKRFELETRLIIN